MTGFPSRRRLTVGLAGLAVAAGSAAAISYHAADLALSHYDARGHLVVARRIFDSLTPGWRQVGAIWLPLPHLLNALPVQIDAFYRSGASAIAVSVASYAAATASVGWIVASITGSAAAAALAAAVFATNPNIVYLQATPMTEPLLLGLLLPAMALLVERGRSGQPGVWPIGGLFALACLTRYEAWPVTAAALALAIPARAGRGSPWRVAVGDSARLAVLPAAAIAAFMAFSRVVVGEWFVASGFFVPDNPARGRPLAAAASLVDGLHRLSDPVLIVVATAGLAGLVVRVARRRQPMTDAVVVALLAAAALPFAAFLSGHPFRIRYMVPLIAVEAIGAGLAAGLLPRGRAPASAVVAMLLVATVRPMDRQAPLILEAMRDRPDALGRARVTRCLQSEYDGRLVLVSMGALGHYLQELSHAGFALRDFVHEGNGVHWQRALDAESSAVGWMLLSEVGDGRDALQAHAARHPEFLRAFTRTCEGGRVALYVRNPP